MVPSDTASTAAIGAGLRENAPTSGFGRFLERMDDRLNPILVREVRQGLRGNAFRNLFWLTLILVTGVCGFTMAMHAVEGDEIGNGQNFFGVSMGLLGLATGYFVPFVAFQSVSSEWEEQTRDLLQLSGLGSWSIVRGKLVAALVQALLFYCAFLPFIAFAFLLRGLDLQEVLLSLNGSLANCLAATTLAILLASMGRTRTLRVFLFAALALGLLMWSGFSAALSTTASFRGGGFAPTLNLWTALEPWLIALLPVSYAITFARNRFAHEYENQSTPLRVLTTFFLCAIPLVGLGLAMWTTVSGGRIDEEVFFALFAGLVALSILFASEGEQMSRRVAARVSRNRLKAWLSIPWLPGGGRGLIFYVLNVSVLGLILITFAWLASGSTRVNRFDLMALLLLALYGFISIGLATFFLRNERSSTNRRVLSVLLACGFPFVGTIISGLGQMAFGRSSEIRVWDIASPPHVISAVTSGTSGYGVFFLLAGAAAFCLALNAKRILASVKEVMSASSDNRKREQIARNLALGSPASVAPKEPA